MTDEARVIAFALSSSPVTIPGGWLTCCPVPTHGRGRGDKTPSLAVKMGAGRVLVHCHAGCAQDAVIDSLRHRGLWGGTPTGHAPDPAELARVHAEARKTGVRRAEQARRVWVQGAAATGSPIEAYLRGRGIVLPPPPTLRYCGGLYHAATGLYLPAMVAAVTRWPYRNIVGIHRTYLTEGPDVRKATVRPDKAMLGAIRGGAARLAPAGPELILGEGIETTLSAMQLFGLPGWAALDAGKLPFVILPDEVHTVHIAADADEAGRTAAAISADAYQRQGRNVQIHLPADGLKDFNDQLRCGRVGRDAA